MKKFSLVFFSLATIFFACAHKALAHVYYVADKEAVDVYGGRNFEVFFGPLKQLDYILLMVLVLVLVFLLYYLLRKTAIVKRLKESFHHKAKEYNRIVPWILRLSAGIMLIGAGTHGWLISPVLNEPTFMVLSGLQIFIGFLLLSGLLTTFASSVLVSLYVLALMQDIYMIGSLEILALGIALIVRDSRFPGVDDLFKIPDFNISIFKEWVPTILRIGIGTAFMYLALFEKVLNPDLSAYVVTLTELTNVIPVSAEMWVFSAGIIEFVVGLAVFVGFKTRLTSMIAFLILSLSFFYFGEDVVSHITLFGVLSVIIVEGAGKWSLDGWLHKRAGLFKSI